MVDYICHIHKIEIIILEIYMGVIPFKNFNSWILQDGFFAHSIRRFKTMTMATKTFINFKQIISSSTTIIQYFCI